MGEISHSSSIPVRVPTIENTSLHPGFGSSKFLDLALAAAVSNISLARNSGNVFGVEIVPDEIRNIEITSVLLPCSCLLSSDSLCSFQIGYSGEVGFGFSPSKRCLVGRNVQDVQDLAHGNMLVLAIQRGHAGGRWRKSGFRTVDRVKLVSQAARDPIRLANRPPFRKSSVPSRQPSPSHRPKALDQESRTRVRAN